MHGAYKLLSDGRILLGEREVAAPPYYMEYSADRIAAASALRRPLPPLGIECWTPTREGLVHGGPRERWLDRKIYLSTWSETWRWVEALQRFPPEPHPHDLWPMLAVFGLDKAAPMERSRRGTAEWAAARELNAFPGTFRGPAAYPSEAAMPMMMQATAIDKTPKTKPPSMMLPGTCRLNPEVVPNAMWYDRATRKRRLAELFEQVN